MDTQFVAAACSVKRLVNLALAFVELKVVPAHSHASRTALPISVNLIWGSAERALVNKSKAISQRFLAQALCRHRADKHAHSEVHVLMTEWKYVSLS